MMLESFLPTSTSELLRYHQSHFGKLPKNVEAIPRNILLKCAAEMIEQNRLTGVRFKHSIYPRTSGIDANGKEYGTEVYVINTSINELRNFPKELIAVTKGEIRINGCVSLSVQGISYFKKNYLTT